MYLSNTNEKIEIVLAGNITTNQLEWTVSYQDITSAGMTLPQSSAQGLTNNTTSVDMVAAPAAATNRQVVYISVYNDDTVDAIVKIKKDVAGIEYIYINQILKTGETLEWSREIGWNIISNTTQQVYKFTSFTSNGTWNKPQGLKAVFICCVGGGGGGGSGARNAAGTNRFGGGGGGGAGVTMAFFTESQISNSITVTIGNGGTGGAGVLVDNTNGNPGNPGTSTTFGSLVRAGGGGGGGGGTTAAGGAGGTGATPSTSNIPTYGPYGWGGNTGASGSTTGVSNGTPGWAAGIGATPGAGNGLGISNTNTAATSAGNGGGIYENGIFKSGGAFGANPNGFNNQSIFLHYSQSLSSGFGLGTAGAGGYPAFPNGGNGGNYGAPGGGGSGVLNGTTSGKGGDGSGGLCVVLEIY